MAKLSYGSGSPSEILEGIADFLSSEDGDASTVILSGVLGIFVSIALGTVEVFQAIIGFPVQMLNSAATSVSALFTGFIESPVGILDSSASTTAREISLTFEGFLGPLAFPAGVASVLLALWLITVYLEEDETSDIFPGSFTDIDVPDPLTPILPDPGVAEEDEEEDARD